jgi:enamine deaminase RidA (YjgF/YER057c/UK114 family)
MTRARVSSGSPYETSIGFSRAVRQGRWIAVSGTAPIADDGSTAYPGDAYRQTLRCLEIVQRALEKLGGRLEDVIRTRVFLTDLESWEDVGRAHGEVFGDIRPASTFVLARLLRDDWKVEIEADALLASDPDER